MNQLRLTSILAALMITVIVLGTPLAAAADKSPRRVIVGFTDTLGPEHRQLIESMGGRILHQYKSINAIAAEMSNRAATSLVLNGKVAYVETDYVRQIETHIDPGVLYDGSYEILPWGVNAVKADEVWDTDHDLAIDSSSSIAGQGVKVAVLDSGIQTDHEDLAANIDFTHSFDFLDMDTDVSDIPGPVTGHGTSTSGIVAAIDNNVGVIGTAPKATIIMYRVCNSALNECPDSAIIAALERAATDGADVVSMSFGGPDTSRPFANAIRSAFHAGMVLVASAGNSATTARHFPSGYSQVISVGATDITNALASFSNFGPKQELVAPGVGTPTTTLNGDGQDVALNENSPTAQSISANPMAFSGLGSLTKNLVFAGRGLPADFAAIDCTDKIALISRGLITFRSKVESATAAGCLGAVIHNSVAGNFFGTLGVPQTIPAVSITLAAGLALRAELAAGPVNVTLDVIALNYETFSGTSASAPYVAGVAALVLSANPSLSNKQVRRVLDNTAMDLGDLGKDIVFGFGLVDAFAAVQCATGVTTCD